ncbi:MAG: type II secretion system protein GspG [Candidatus Hydrogenedentota bacterium]
MKSNSGFTLLELLLVMVIIGILAGAVAVGVAGRGREARETRAKSDLSTYQRMIEAYALENNDQYPKALNDLVNGKKQYVVQIKNDPWGRPYGYKTPGKNRPYDLFTAGMDGQAGTPDDISVWSEN